LHGTISRAVDKGKTSQKIFRPNTKAKGEQGGESLQKKKLHSEGGGKLHSRYKEKKGGGDPIRWGWGFLPPMDKNQKWEKMSIDPRKGGEGD